MWSSGEVWGKVRSEAADSSDVVIVCPLRPYELYVFI